MSFTNFIKRPVLSTVVSIFFVLLGIIGLVSLPIEQYPNIAPPTIQVSTTYQGADAQGDKDGNAQEGQKQQQNKYKQSCVHTAVPPFFSSASS